MAMEIEQRILNDLVNAVKNNQLTLASGIDVITYTMQAIEKVKNLSGAQKAEYVASILQLVVDNKDKLELPEGIFKTLVTLLAMRHVLFSIMKSIVDASKGGLQLNIAEIPAGPLASCFACFGGGAKPPGN